MLLRKLERSLLLRCDQCEHEFERSNNVQRQLKLRYHFCSRKCSQAARSRTGVLRPIMEETMRRKMGDDWSKQISIKAQAATSAEEKKERAQKAMRTVQERYGVRSAVEIPHVRAAADVVRGSTESTIKRKATTKARFGVESVLSLPEVHALANTPEKCRQRHETMKRNGSYFNSRNEDAFYSWLVGRFGEDDVERQVVVSKWPIDFHVKSIDTYVQFDGEYWHGLDRPIEEIMLFKTSRDKTILRKFQIDREQDAWCAENSLRFVRVTDKQFKRGEVDL